MNEKTDNVVQLRSPGGDVDLGAITETAINAIQGERARQILVEGFAAETDDAHTAGQLAEAAAAYAYAAAFAVLPGRARSMARDLWPSSWPRDWCKVKDARSNLVRAGALILAEIERLDRAAARAAGVRQVKPEPRPALRPDGIPTRICVENWSPAELAIAAAMETVERAGASTALTDAVVLLARAKSRVADHVEGNGDAQTVQP